MNIEMIRERFAPAIQEITEQCQVTEGFVDKDLFRVYLATVWGNAVLDPGQSGLTESDLPALHDFLNEEVAKLLGRDETVTSVYEYFESKAGEEAMERLSVGARHREFITYFARLMRASTDLPLT